MRQVSIVVAKMKRQQSRPQTEQGINKKIFLKQEIRGFKSGLFLFENCLCAKLRCCAKLYPRHQSQTFFGA